MLLPRAIVFTCLVYYTQGLNLSKRSIEDNVSANVKTTDHVLKTAELNTARSETGHVDLVSEKRSEHVQSKDDNFNSDNTFERVESKNVASESEHGASKSVRDGNNVHANKDAAQSERASVNTDDVSEKLDVNSDKSASGDSKTVSEHATYISKRGAANDDSGSESATKHAVQTEKVSNAVVSEKSATNADVISEKPSTVVADAVSEKSDASADNVSKNSAANGDAVSEKSAVNTDTTADKTALNVNVIYEKSGLNNPVETDLKPENGRRNNNSKWCQNLKNCQSNKIEVCGYDERAGFAKFVDFCHLIEVNCYWGNDFTLHSCEAMQLKYMERPQNVFNK